MYALLAYFLLAARKSARTSKKTHSFQAGAVAVPAKPRYAKGNRAAEHTGLRMSLLPCCIFVAGRSPTDWNDMHTEMAAGLNADAVSRHYAHLRPPMKKVLYASALRMAGYGPM